MKGKWFLEAKSNTVYEPHM